MSGAALERKILRGIKERAEKLACDVRFGPVY
jgi:hypothetical protein